MLITLKLISETLVVPEQLNSSLSSCAVYTKNLSRCADLNSRFRGSLTGSADIVKELCRCN